MIPEGKGTGFISRIPGPAHSSIPTPSSKRPGSGGKRPSPQGQLPSPKQTRSGSKLPQPGGASPQVVPRKLAGDKTFELPAQPTEVEGRGEGNAPPPAGVARVSPPTDEVTDLNQRLSILQSKRAEDKTRIKELEKFKAHYNQVWCVCVCVCVCV